jgi:hypothetical protein
MFIRKLFNGLTLRCIGALCMGLAVVLSIAAGLLVLTANAAEESPAPAEMAAFNLRFPEDEQMLKDLSAEILRDAALADGRDLNEVQPAAGAPAPAN